jgi:two-component system, sensor histidine kinase and response regulator
LPRILLVDDEPLNLALLRGRLTPLGYELVDASSGEEALELLAKESFDMVLLDVRMPGMGGMETARRIKQLVSARDGFVPVVMLTALDDENVRREGLEAGADDFLGKPFNASELLLRIRNLLALRADRMALQGQNARLLKLQRFKEEMAALLVHDLKSPAAAILLNLDASMETTSPESETYEPLISARGACQRMLRLLANILDIARAEDDQLKAHRQQVPLADFIAPLVQARQRMALMLDRRLEAQLEPGVVASIDPDLIGRVVENIFDNAMRHTPRKGRIQISTRRCEDQLQIRIGNTGARIPPEDCMRIFEKYAQLSPEGTYINNGLGLYFCRLAVEAHGGRIWVEEEPDQPTVFVIGLPVEVSGDPTTLA